MLHSIRKSIEKHLYLQGFSSADVRRIVSTQILVALYALTLGLACVWFSVWPLVFGIGAALAACNLWWLAHSAQWALKRHYSPRVALAGAVRFIMRFVSMAVTLYFILIVCTAPVIPLVAGFTTVLAGLTAWGVSRISGQSAKEA